jgi:SPP1 family predicted phage head-tail adaptor
MNAGRLRHRVDIQNYVEEYDELGQLIEDWLPFAQVWAAVEPLRGQEFIAAQALASVTTTRIRMRYIPGVVSSMRVVFRGRTYNIQSVIEVETRGREIQLMCRSLGP